jgi:catechol 2,3-dioxygenase-like lactoylglutathione lyase family enzyme
MKSPIRIREFAFIVYPATHRDRARAFYEDVLGLSRSTSIQEGDRFWIEYEIGPHTLGIGNEPSHLANLAALREALECAGGATRWSHCLRWK